jgi:HK97 family phage portal protein
MGLVDRLIRGAEYRSFTSNLANPADWLTDAFGGTRSAAGERVTVSNALGLAAVWAAVSRVSEAVGQLPLKVYKDIGDGEKVEARSHRAWRMLHDQPNPLTPAHRFWSTVVVHERLYGNAFVRKLRNELGLVDELWLLDPATVSVEWDAVRKLKRFVEERNGERIIYSSEDIVHIMGMSLDGVMGLSPIAKQRDPLGTALARDKFEGSFYRRGTAMTGIIEHPKELKENALKNLRESFQAVYGGAGNAFRTPVLEEGASFRPIQMLLSDLQFIEAKRLTATEIAIIFGIPPGRLGGSTGDSLTYATVEGNQIEFVQDAIKPVALNIAKYLAADPGLFPFNAWYPEFVLEGLMQGDAKARSDYYTAQFNLVDEEGKRALTVDEIRALENRSPAAKPAIPPAPAVPPANGNGNGNGQLSPVELAALTQGSG